MAAPTISGNDGNFRIGVDDEDFGDQEQQQQQESSSSLTMAAAPFVRYDLKSSALVLPLPLPDAMVQRNVPVNSWNDFWLKVQPIVRNVEFYDSVFNAILIVLTIAALILVLAFIVVETEGELVNFIYWAVVMIVLFAAFGSISGNKRTAQLQQLRLLCKDEEERIFKSCGYALECEFEWGIITEGTSSTNVSTYGFRIYFLPAGLTESAAAPDNSLTLSTNDSESSNVNDFQHGYLRILLYNSGSCGCSWTPFSLSYLHLFTTLPIGFESLTAWPSFWSEMCAISEKCLLSYRLQFVAQWAYAIIILTMIILADTEANRSVHSVVLFLFLTAIIAFFIVSCRFTTLMNARSFLAQQSSGRFLQQGVYMEYRTLYKFHRYAGMYGVHYLYLFPTDTLRGGGIRNGDNGLAEEAAPVTGPTSEPPDTTIV